MVNKHPKEGRSKMLKILLPGAMAGFLLLGVSDAKACCINVSLWVNVGVESTSTVIVTEKLCMGAASQIFEQGWRFQTAVPIQHRLNALMFTKSGARGGLATLFCAANVIEELLD